MSADENPVRATVQEASPVLRVLRVEVAASRVEEAFDAAYRDLARRVRVKGFRPGRTPRSVLERLYGEAIVEDVERQLVASSLPEAVAETGVAPVAEPSIDADTPRAGAAFGYTARCEVCPDLEVPDLGGLRGRRPVVRVGPEEVETELAALRERRASLVALEPATPIAPGHFAHVDYVGRIDGELFQGGSAQGVHIEIGAGHFLPGFEEQLEGAVAGDDVEVRATFPEDYGWDEVAGKEAVFAVHVASVKRREVPELDDAFAQGLGEFASLEALRDRIRTDLERSRQERARARLRESLMDVLLERADFPVPPALVDRRLERRLEMAHRELHQTLPHDEIHRRIAQWREEWRPAAERDLREELLLDAVGRAQGFEADDAAIDERIDAMAREQGVDPERLRKSLAERDMRGALAEQIVRDRALEHLIEAADVEEFEESAEA